MADVLAYVAVVALALAVVVALTVAVDVLLGSVNGMSTSGTWPTVCIGLSSGW